MAVCLATGFYLSLVPTWILHQFKHHKKGQFLNEKKLTGAGLAGSLEGAITYYLLPPFLAHAWWAILIGIAFSVWISTRAEKVLQVHDDSRIVIDEWIGVWVALWGVGQQLSLLFIATVLLFRFFDVMKGPLGRRFQHWPGGWGVCMDDIYAGLAANLTWRLSLFLISVVRY